MTMWLWFNEHTPAVLAASGFLLAWIAVQWHRRRRLRLFADPEVLGLQERWLRKGAGLALLLGGISAIGVIVGLPEVHSDTAPDRSRIFILIDSGAPAGRNREASDSWDRIRTAVADILETESAHSFALYASGNAPIKLIPETRDRMGVRMLLDRLEAHWQPPAGGSLRGSIQGLWQSAAEQRHVILVMTGSSREEVEANLRGFPEPAPMMIVVTLRDDAATGGFGIQSGNGAWRWINQRNRVLQYVAALEVEAANSRQRSSLTKPQGMALLALVLLTLEALLAGVPAGIKRIG